MTKKREAKPEDDYDYDYGRPLDDPDCEFDNEQPSDPGRYVALDGVVERQFGLFGRKPTPAEIRGIQ